ncbi:mammalian cell entry protein [Mycobacterium koreense]|uniref:Uncharacterized protein n=1 Tax=Mycolicibacillus koreensis TaxID=1069220 RepID=A0A7I7SK50_9MYCO|nr:hypothetical protein [Mycolicibacillus koreensis]MCV7250508.1 mammalian cell entry protein [Mycolicibacillus koreensis]OSC32755.1 hypothetical protein B8W67_14230 [Mycolicibacillus koreensis]BBY56375.1 hypothetical protein MKOR_36260 [Mycolicibacillus koreensis]
MADVVNEETTRIRRRASRQAGPAGEPATARVPLPATAAPARPPTLRRPGRRRAPEALLAAAAGVTALVMTVALAAAVAVLAARQHTAHAEQQRAQRFVDTASQTVVNMFTFRQDALQESIDLWINDLAGPLRDKFSQPGAVDALTKFLHYTNNDSEATINSAALEDIDEETNRASVLIAARVTPTNIDDGVNQPSQPYRLRVVVQEDSSGTMRAYDLLWPGGGN